MYSAGSFGISYASRIICLYFLRLKPLVEAVPKLLTPLDGTFLLIPDAKYDQEYGMEYDTYDLIPAECRDPKICARAIELYWSTYISCYSFGVKPPGGEVVWAPVRMPHVYKERDVYRFEYPEFGINDIEQVTEGPYAHLKTTIYNKLNVNNDHVFQGELLPILRLMLAHLRRARFIDHMVVPIMAFSFMGPQHARIIEAYMEGYTVVMRPTKLYDLRNEDAPVFKTFARWYFGKPCAPTGSSQ